jgi:hypothetical protein
VARGGCAACCRLPAAACLLPPACCRLPAAACLLLLLLLVQLAWHGMA